MASGAWLGLKTCHSSQMKTAPQQWVPVTTIQKLMGHAWLVSTQTYIAANDRKVQADFYAAAQQLAGWQDEPKQGAA